MESEEVESSTPPGSAMSSVVVADGRREKKSMETARLRYLEKVKELDLESLECRRELAETLGIERVSHEDLNRHHCIDWLKAHEAHFSRAKLMETTDLTGIPTKTIMGPINYRPLKLLGGPGLITEPPKHRTGIARIRLATPAQLKVVDKLLNPGEWNCLMPLTKVRSWQKIPGTGSPVVAPNWPKLWQFMIEQIQLLQE